VNFLRSSTGRKVVFACLYLSEGAPIGFIWLALPTRLRASGVPVEQITGLTALLVLPWTFKFLGAPFVDLLRMPRWTLRHWVVTAQIVMGLTLLPLVWVDPKQQFAMLTWILFAHAMSASMQDVAIDALCISATHPGERGEYNGWMQTGMLLGRALMGGGGLVLASYLGDAAVVGILVVLTTFSAVLVMVVPLPTVAEVTGDQRWRYLVKTLASALAERNMWLGLLFAATGGAAFKSLEVVYGPYLVDRGFDEETIGWFSLGPMIVCMVLGSLLGGWIADRKGPRRCVIGSLAFISSMVIVLAITDHLGHAAGQGIVLPLLAATAFGIGMFTTSSYALFMDVTRPAIAAVQFSAFMGATNGCESWSSYASGRIISVSGYPTSLLLMSLISLATVPLVLGFRLNEKDSPAV